MPRLRQIPKAEAHETARSMYQLLFGDRDPVADPGTATGTPGNWWTVFAKVPECFDHAVAGFVYYRSPTRKLAPELRELAQTRAGYARQSQFVFSQHCKAERAVLAYTDCLVLEGGRVPDPVFDALKATLDDAEILELTYVTCLYEMHATICRALKLEFDDVDERIREVPAPAGAMQDVMAAVDKAKK